MLYVLYHAHKNVAMATEQRPLEVRLEQVGVFSFSAAFQSIIASFIIFLSGSMTCFHLPGLFQRLFLQFPCLSLGMTGRGCRGATWGNHTNSGAGGATRWGCLFAQGLEKVGTGEQEGAVTVAFLCTLHSCSSPGNLAVVLLKGKFVEREFLERWDRAYPSSHLVRKQIWN